MASKSAMSGIVGMQTGLPIDSALSVEASTSSAIKIVPSAVLPAREALIFQDKIGTATAELDERRRKFRNLHNHMRPDRRRCFYLAVNPIVLQATSGRDMSGG